MIEWLAPGAGFPPLDHALKKPNGLLAEGGDLSPERLLQAYRLGIFPWFGQNDPILWWSPDPRMVLFPDQLKISRSLKKTLHKKNYDIRVDSAFAEVMKKCAAPRKDQGGTWISDKMIEAYSILFDMGFAHSVETWINDELVGGLYGVALGKVFFGESMFSRKTDASKIAFAHLVSQLKKWDFKIIDCQMTTSHLASLGAVEISRTDFSGYLAQWAEIRPEKWIFDKDV